MSEKFYFICEPIYEDKNSKIYLFTDNKHEFDLFLILKLSILILTIISLLYLLLYSLGIISQINDFEIIFFMNIFLMYFLIPHLYNHNWINRYSFEHFHPSFYFLANSKSFNLEKEILIKQSNKEIKLFPIENPKMNLYFTDFYNIYQLDSLPGSNYNTYWINTKEVNSQNIKNYHWSYFNINKDLELTFDSTSIIIKPIFTYLKYFIEINRSLDINFDNTKFIIIFKS